MEDDYERDLEANSWVATIENHRQLGRVIAEFGSRQWSNGEDLPWAGVAELETKDGQVTIKLELVISSK